MTIPSSLVRKAGKTNAILKSINFSKSFTLKTDNLHNSPRLSEKPVLQEPGVHSLNRHTQKHRVFKKLHFENRQSPQQSSPLRKTRFAGARRPFLSTAILKNTEFSKSFTLKTDNLHNSPRLSEKTKRLHPQVGRVEKRHKYTSSFKRQYARRP